MEDIKIDLTKTRHFEAGAIVLATLALPAASDEDKGSLIYSLCHRALRAKFDLAKREAHIEQLMKPLYVFRDTTDTAISGNSIG